MANKTETRGGQREIVLPPITVYSDGYEPPPSDIPGGFVEPDDKQAVSEPSTPALANIESPRVDPSLDQLEELVPQPAPAADQRDTESLVPDQTVLPLSDPVQPAPKRVEVEQPTSTQPEQPPGSQIVSLEDREKFSAADAEFRGTIQGAARLNQWVTTKQWLEANPNATDEQLLAKFTPGLLRTRWVERRQAMVDYLRDAPRLHDEARANLDGYDAMPSARTAAEFVALARGELYVAATSFETLLGGGSAKGATWLLRGLKTVLREAGTAAVTDSIRQWQNIEAGLQGKFDGWRTAVSAGVAGIFGGISNADVDSVRLGIKSKVQSIWKARKLDLERRVAEVEKFAAERPVSEKYAGAILGEASHYDYARTFHQTNKGLQGKVEVHHAIEQNVLDWYPGLFSKREIHSVENLRGIPKNTIGSALHRSVIRGEWDEFRLRHWNKYPTRQEVIEYATAIDRKYGGLFDPPL